MKHEVPESPGTTSELLGIYHDLLRHYGPQGWWPADSAAEVIIGAILVQHTSWKNVVRAVHNLKSHEALDFRVLADSAPTTLARLIRPAGTPSVKARRLQAFARWLGRAWDYDLATALNRPLDPLRRDLLNIHGIGPETADCIILYAARQPSFVTDTYAHRLAVRHLLVAPDISRHRLQTFFHTHLPREVNLFNEFHALVVKVGKEHCRAIPRCNRCPLQHLPHQDPR